MTPVDGLPVGREPSPPGPREAPPLDYQAGQTTPRRWGTGFLPAAASLYLPGLGHLIAGQRRAAARWFAAYLIVLLLALTALGVPPAVPALILLVPMSVVLGLACAVAAFRTGVRDAGHMLGHPAPRYLAGVGLLLAPLVFHPAEWVARFARDQLAEAFIISSGGMAPALAPGDRVIAHKRLAAIKRWDVVAFDSPQVPGERWVQRVAGLPGETIELIDGELMVHGQVVPRPAGVGPYLTVRPGALRGGFNATDTPLTLGPDEYFVLGDSSMFSFDSRYWNEPPPGRRPGILPAGHIVGRVTTIYWPISRWRRTP